ncbi:hypothetical protein MRB53_013671 [Persea americana]|uniref:Uncharacterized protein n=1 Tax=Persea americana TaxID=3435 RepID=A0ACC2K8M5_PERAE|nr:hypothetical protein MRB53_013671 [Persea americana]
MAGGLAAVRGEGGAVQDVDDVGEDVGWEGGNGGRTAGFAGFGGDAEWLDSTSVDIEEKAATEKRTSEEAISGFRETL